MEKTDKSKIKKIVLTAISILLLLIVVLGMVFLLSAKKDFESEQKSVVSMNTVVTSKTYGKATGGINETVCTLVQDVDKMISCHNENSIVSKLNTNGKISSREIADMINLCTSVSRDTNGRFDISIAPVSFLWNFGGEKNQIPNQNELKTAKKLVDYTKISARGNNITLNMGQKIDLGSVGKGYACDVVSAYLENTDIKGAVLSVGGSILTYGKRNQLGEKWRVAIKHPRKENEFLGVVNLENGFVSTSGDYEQYFEKDGKRYHHILDAKTGFPADNELCSVTIVAKTGILSDALSTACFILGMDEGKKLCEKYDASGVFVTKDLKCETVGDIDFEESK